MAVVQSPFPEMASRQIARMESGGGGIGPYFVVFRSINLADGPTMRTFLILFGRVKNSEMEQLADTR